MRQAQYQCNAELISERPSEDPAIRHARRIESFAPGYRRLVQELTASSKAFEDLADTFPALLFALATGYGEATARHAALACIAGGAPLRAAAEALGLPWWLRRLPAQAFTMPLAAIPVEPEFAARIPVFLPSQPSAAALWLTRVVRAYQACDAEFALWVARQHRAVGAQMTDENLAYLAAWAWHAGRPE